MNKENFERWVTVLQHLGRFEYQFPNTEVRRTKNAPISESFIRVKNLKRDMRRGSVYQCTRPTQNFGIHKLSIESIVTPNPKLRPDPEEPRRLHKGAAGIRGIIQTELEGSPRDLGEFAVEPKFKEGQVQRLTVTWKTAESYVTARFSDSGAEEWFIEGQHAEEEEIIKAKVRMKLEEVLYTAHEVLLACEFYLTQASQPISSATSRLIGAGRADAPPLLADPIFSPDELESIEQLFADQSEFQSEIPPYSIPELILTPPSPQQKFPWKEAEDGSYVLETTHLKYSVYFNTKNSITISVGVDDLRGSSYFLWYVAEHHGQDYTLKYLAYESELLQFPEEEFSFFMELTYKVLLHYYGLPEWKK